MHHWIGVSDDEDHCFTCGVVSPDLGKPGSIVADHGPLPIWCPGPERTGDKPAHHFGYVGPVGERDGYLYCYYCGAVIDDSTKWADFEWACERDE